MRELARDVLRHRMVLSYEALAEGLTPDDLLSPVLESVALPQVPLRERSDGSGPQTGDTRWNVPSR